MLGLLPTWLDIDALKNGSAVVTAVLALAAVGALAWIRRPGWRFSTALVLLALSGATLYYRTTLDDCERTCSCKFINDRVRTPGCPNVEVDENPENGFH